jgi:4-diphosphocytidyl-2-C-methyl-D-erythritol kinase
MTSPVRSVAITAPAKINLGLEILGKRADGYHEIRTLMAMLEFGDELVVSGAATSSVRGVPGVGADANLISRAVRIFQELLATDVNVDIAVSKRIPMAAGLGGASADAAATLLAVNALMGVPMESSDLLRIAALLGSDVPFFLGSPLALSSGTGTELRPLEPTPFDVILIVPDLTIPDKTKTLYGMLEASDFSDGNRIGRGIRSLAKREVPDRQVLANAFERPLYSLMPALKDLRQILETVDCLAVGLSGAGPAHYVVPNPARVPQTEHTLRALMPSGMQMISTRFRISGLRGQVTPNPGHP